MMIGLCLNSDGVAADILEIRIATISSTTVKICKENQIYRRGICRTTNKEQIFNKTSIKHQI